MSSDWARDLQVGLLQHPEAVTYDKPVFLARYEELMGGHPGPFWHGVRARAEGHRGGPAPLGSTTVQRFQSNA